MQDVTPLLRIFLEAEGARDTVIAWANKTAIQETYQPQILCLTRKESGFQLSATTMTEEALTTFNIEDLAARMEVLAPDLWALLGILLSANGTNNQRRRVPKGPRSARASKGNDADKGKELGDGNINMGDVNTDELADESAFGETHVRLVAEDEDEPEDFIEQEAHRENVLVSIKKAVCMSIMMQSTNRNCNALQSVVGIFLHSCNAPETITELLAHMGLSIASSTVNAAVVHLSQEAYIAMRHMGESFLVSYAYDNLDIDFKHTVPTVEKPQDSLVHITSGTMLPLYHGITRADLDCSDFLWRKYYRNPNIQMQDLPRIPYYDLLNIYPEPPLHLSGLNRRERFNAWKYRSDLVNFGPEYFRTFRKELGDPEAIKEIPIIKTSQRPLRAIDVSPSTPGGNVEALNGFFQQTEIGDPRDSNGKKCQPISNSVILIFGDLLTGQHLRSVLESRALETTPWRRMQFTVFVMGLFHLKMACADAIWRIFINHKKSQVDDTGLMSFVGEIRPKETGKILTKPGFRQMHEVIQHVGIVTHLDMWRIEAENRNRAHRSLDDWAESKPTWDEVVQMSYNIIRRERETSQNVNRQRTREETERDQQYENAILRRKYFLLYEEMSHALNHGDIGRVEDLFVPWINIFIGCGKHKYATEMRRYLENVHFVYPAGLKHAVQMNILCNPTGKKGHFRAIDWQVEHNNLYTKVCQRRCETPMHTDALSRSFMLESLRTITSTESLVNHL
ncbi:hypothetical protein B0H34DRAFT_660621 [Crassisporium funariophilum]|nr:hypothetical protein B0H34DRAFT_660621 [Crassisporium funariophilum]